MITLSPVSLREFASHGTSVIVDAISTTSAAALARWDINTARRLWMVLAHISVESAGLTTVFEDMDYSAARAHAVWPKWFSTVASAEPYANNPQKLANHVYGKRMGNVGPDDGWLCRGTGCLMATGLTEFERLAKGMEVSVDQVRANLTDPKHMFDCACALFSIWGCLPYADRGDVTGCTRVINGGLIGLADREAAYQHCQRVWPSTLPIFH